MNNTSSNAAGSNAAPHKLQPITDRFAQMPAGPFARLNALLAPLTPSGDPVLLSLGEPKHPIPEFVAPILAQHINDFGRYPPIMGTVGFRDAVKSWLIRRFDLPIDALDADHHIMPVNGTREALFNLPLVASPPEKNGKRPLILMPNPFYQCYAAGALAAGAKPVYVSATAATNHLPDFAGLSDDTLNQTSMVYACSPANPQGAVMSLEDLKTLITLARHHHFILAVDECYADIYDKTPPASALQACLSLPTPPNGDPFSNVIVFHSLSKRSSLPGLRSGFIAGDKALMNKLRAFRNIAAPQTPLPLLAVATAAWNDDAHAAENRTLYQQKIDMAENILGNQFDFYRPAGGFFLWLNVGDGINATKKLWEQGALKVLPGAYLAREDESGHNPSKEYIRIALVQDLATTRTALTQIADILGS